MIDTKMILPAFQSQNGVYISSFDMKWPYEEIRTKRADAENDLIYGVGSFTA